jgi:hypothetical protein
MRERACSNEMLERILNNIYLQDDAAIGLNITLVFNGLTFTLSRVNTRAQQATSLGCNSDHQQHRTAETGTVCWSHPLVGPRLGLMN